MKKFTDSHEWVDVINGVGTIGITDFAQKELGDIVYVELPKIGKSVKAGEPAAVLESTKAAADVYSPLSGDVTEVNNALKDRSDLVNISPEKDGWLFKIKVTKLEEFAPLKTVEEYNSIIN